MPRPDPTQVLLRFVGPAVRGAPARDLTRHDIERIAYRQALALTYADGIRPATPTAAAIRQMTDDLVARGRYVRVKKET
jgi:hypothetical protein